MDSGSSRTDSISGKRNSLDSLAGQSFEAKENSNNETEKLIPEADTFSDSLPEQRSITQREVSTHQASQTHTPQENRLKRRNLKPVEKVYLYLLRKTRAAFSRVPSVVAITERAIRKIEGATPLQENALMRWAANAPSELERQHRLVAAEKIAICIQEGQDSLNLSQCNLSSLPDELGDLIWLEEINLRGNQLTSLPPSISKLKNLEYIDCSHNSFTAIPEELTTIRSLRQASFSYNQLAELPDSFRKLKNLEHLHLDHNQFKSIPAPLSQFIAHSVQHITSLGKSTSCQIWFQGHGIGQDQAESWKHINKAEDLDLFCMSRVKNAEEMSGLTYEARMHHWFEVAGELITGKTSPKILKRSVLKQPSTPT